MSSNDLIIGIECDYCGNEFPDFGEYSDHTCKGERIPTGFCSLVRDFTAPVMLAKEGKEAPDSPIMMSPEAVEFIQNMVEAEMTELYEADTIAEQADALVDAIYYICDTAVRHGVNLDRVFHVVHQSNMQKVQDGKIILSDKGKVEKPEGFKPPDIEEVIKQQTEEGSWP